MEHPNSSPIPNLHKITNTAYELLKKKNQRFHHHHHHPSSSSSSSSIIIIGGPMTVVELTEEGGAKLTVLGNDILTESGALKCTQNNKQTHNQSIFYLSPPDEIQHVQYNVKAGTWFGSYPNEVWVNNQHILWLQHYLPRHICWTCTSIIDWETYIYHQQQGTKYSFVGCTVSPGFEFSEFELGSRAALLEQYPDAHDVIVKLTEGLPWKNKKNSYIQLKVKVKMLALMCVRVWRVV
jgi:predicted cupin superfamily sugar epimerase